MNEECFRMRNLEEGQVGVFEDLSLNEFLSLGSGPIYWNEISTNNFLDKNMGFGVESKDYNDFSK